MDKPLPKIAVTYVRVSTTKQVKEGSGASSQRVRCEQFAASKDMEVVNSFGDEGVSGAMVKRPGMIEMLSYVKKQKGGCVVIIDDISRLARGVMAHFELRAMIEAAGGVLLSPSIEFGSSPDEILVENLMATVAQHFRDKNRETVINRTMARLKQGYSTVSVPAAGYVYKRVNGHGKLMVRDEPVATIVQNVLEGFASGRFETQAEVKRYLDKQAAFPSGKNGVHYQKITNMLSNLVYAGYLHFPQRGIHMVPAKHDPLISYDTYLSIQKRLEYGAKAPARKDLNVDFPLRGFIECSCCGSIMTSSKAKGRNQYYAYYHCFNKQCELYAKSFGAEKIESEFEDLLIRIQPSRNVYDMALRACKMIWDKRLSSSSNNVDALKKESGLIEDKISRLVERIAATSNEKLADVYENSIQELEVKKVEIREKIMNLDKEKPNFDKCFGTAFKFLANPYEIWASGYEGKRTVLRLMFKERLKWDVEKGLVGTASIAQPFRLTEQLKRSNYDLVELAGIE